MAGSYTLPQVRVFQEFAQTPNDVTQNLNPFVIGPNYQLIRYSDADERSGCRTGTYANAALTLNWAAGYSGSTPDITWYKVTLKDAYVKLGDELTPTCLDATTGNGTKFEFTLTNNKSLVGTDSSKLQFPVAVKAGDYLSYMSGTTRKYTKIREISCGKLASSEIATALKNKATGADFSGFTVGTTNYVGEKPVNVKIHITSTTEGSTTTFKMTWTSNVAGIASSSETTISTTAINLGKGLTVTPVSASMAKGDYVLTVTLVEPYSRDTVTVVDLVPYNSTFTFVRKVDEVEVDDAYLSADATAVSVASGVLVDIGASTGVTVLSATAYLTQRNFVKSHTDGVYSVGTDGDIVRELGAIVPENPLAYGLHVMLLNCATATLKYIAVESDDLEGYAKALDRASVTSDVYALCPMTEDGEIIDAVVAHCKSLSTEEEKSWRIAFFSKPTESEVDVTPNVYGVPEKCKVTGTTLTCYNGDTANESSVADFTSTVRVGDTVTVINTAAAPVTTTVAAVTSSTTLTLKETVTSADSANCRFTIIHEREPAEYVSAIAATSSYFRNRRAYNVFPNKLRVASGEYVSGMFAAAAVCGLACSVAPQQPITNVEINGFTDLPDVYSKYNRDQLNEIAAGGTIILMQDKVGGTVYVRHQISTAYPDGNLNTTELSLTKNLDSISYYFANRFAPYIGRYNLTDDLLAEIKGVLLDGLAHLETATETNRLIGPQVIADGTEVRSLYRDPDEKDKAYADVALNLPAPFNNFDLRLQVI